MQYLLKPTKCAIGRHEAEKEGGRPVARGIAAAKKASIESIIGAGNNIAAAHGVRAKA